MKQRQNKANEPDGSQPQEALNLSEQEEQEIQQRMRPRAAILHETIRIEGETELGRKASALAWSGLAAGLSMGFSLVGRGLLEANLPTRNWRSIIASFGYSLGFVIVVMGRQQLFTENTLTVILPLLSRRSRKAFKQVARLWSIVLLSNLLGTFVFAWIVGHVAIFSTPVQEAFTQIGLKTMQGAFWITLWRSVFAGWLIALMVWLLPAAEASRLWVIIIITTLVGLGEFSHVIAGSVEALYAVMVGVASWGDYGGKFLVPTLLGNILGGVSLVAALNYAQVAPEKG